MTSHDAPATSLPPAVLAALRCSVCARTQALSGNSLRCEAGHSFDVARQGYVNLLHAKVPPGTADTGEMVTAREEFLGAGHYAPLARALADMAAGRFVIDAGAGTGYYLATVLDAHPGAAGLALDLSVPASRRAARAHPRIGAAVWNVWQPWPVGDGVADVVLNVFAPRNANEFHRVLRPGGTLLVTVPGSDHLVELRDALGLLAIDSGKQDRLGRELAGRLEVGDTRSIGGRATLPADDVRRAVLMGPNAYHLDRGGLRERLAAVEGMLDVTISFDVVAYRRVG